MIFDYISDIHGEFFVPRPFSSYGEYIDYLWGDHKDGDILILAGDIAESIDRVKKIISEIEKRRSYKEIFYVPGNHDLYHDNFKGQRISTLFQKQLILQREVNKIEKATMLNGQIITLSNGLKISGSVMWYDPSYLKKQMKDRYSEDRYLSLWRAYMLDSRRTHTNPIEFFEKEFEKLKKVYQEVDIFVSHINPVNLDSHMDPQYWGQSGNTFFCFHGNEILENGSIKHWFYGHTHSEAELEFAGVKLHCNPMGYPGENIEKPSYIKSIEI